MLNAHRILSCGNESLERDEGGGRIPLGDNTGVGTVMLPPARLHCVEFGFQLQCLIYRLSQEERTKLREGVPYVKLYRYNPKHLYPKLSGYGDNGQRKVWTSCISA